MYGDSLLRAILADPEDPVARLAYADLLEEAGDLRAQLIRTQCQLEGLEADHPNHWTLQNREIDLLQRSAPYAGPRARCAWTCDEDYIPWVRLVREFGPVFAQCDYWQFHWGFLETCRIPAREYLTHGAAIRSATPLKSLSLTEVRGASHLSQHRARIEELRGVQAPAVVLEGEEAVLARLEQAIEIQDLVSCQLLDGLTALRLGDLNLGPEEFETLLASRWLEDLHEFELQLTTPTRACYTRLGRLNQLKRLRIDCSNQEAGGETWEAGAALVEQGGLQQLESLSLRSHRFQQDQTLELVRNLPKLRHLDLQAKCEHISYLSASELIQVLKCPEIARIRSLNLSHLGFGEEGVAALTHCKRLSGLEQLCLAASGEPDLLLGLESRALQLLAQSKHLTSLRALSVVGHRCGEAGAIALADSAVLDRVVELNLRCQRIGAEGMRRLACSPHLKSLEYLNLRENPSAHLGLPGSPLASRLRGLRFGESEGLGDWLRAGSFDVLVELAIPRLLADLVDALRTSLSAPNLRTLIFHMTPEVGFHDCGSVFQIQRPDGRVVQCFKLGWSDRSPG